MSAAFLSKHCGVRHKQFLNVALVVYGANREPLSFSRVSSFKKNAQMSTNDKQSVGKAQALITN